MIKKLAFCTALSALILTGCTSEEPLAGSSEGGNVTFTAEIPSQILTKANISDGTTATKLTYAVYNDKGDEIAGLGDTVDIHTSTTVTLNLVTGKEYTVLFWAQAENAPYEFDTKTGIVTVKEYENVASQDENRDAFFACETFKVNGSVNKTVKLNRPFAQINVLTTDLAEFKAAGETISQAGLKVTAPTTLNLKDGSVGNEEEYTFTNAIFPDESETLPLTIAGKTMTWLVADYVLVGSAKETIDVTWTSNTSVTERQSITYTSVPVQRNYRTNIWGALLTDAYNYNVEINDSYTEEPGHEYVVNNAVCTKDEDNNIVCVTPALPEEITTEDFTTNDAGVACISSDGEAKYFPATSKGLFDAMEFSNEIYLAPNSEITMKSHEAKIPSTGIRIYGNGATITGAESDFSLAYTTFEEGSNVDIYIENLNNARVWGDATVACTLNVTLNNCTFIGGGYGGTNYKLGLIMMRAGDNALATHNITLENCYCEGVQVGMHSTSAGTFKFDNCIFNNVGIPINIAKKSTDEASVSVEGCTFINCGLEENGSDDAWNYAAPIRVVNNGGPDNSMSVTIKDTSITGRKGQYDVLLTDYRAGKTAFKVSYNITNSGELVVKD